MSLDAIGADASTLARVADVLAAPSTAGIAALVAAGELDPARDFINIDMRGWPLAGEDVRGFDFSGSDLRGTGVEKARRDDTTILDGARLDPHALHLVGLAPIPRRPRARPETYDKVRIPDLSDAEMLERTFIIYDPLALENLVDAAPPTDQWLTYEGRYDIDNPVTCAFGHLHKRGYAFRDEENRRYLVGNSCGAKHLGLGSWKVFAKGREMLEDRASHLRSVRDLRELFVRNRDWIAGLSNHPAVVAFDAARSVLWGRHPALVQAVQTSSYAGGGRLSLLVEERDFAAEERIRERNAKHAIKGGISLPTERPEVTKHILRDAGILRGRIIFNMKVQLRQELAYLIRFVDAFLAGRGLQTRRDLVETTRNANSLVNRILAVSEAVDDFFGFFDQSNLRLFASWGNQNRFDYCRFTTVSNRVTITSDLGNISTTLVRPPVERLDSERISDLAASSASWKARTHRRHTGISARATV